jgi:hypothetical protein
MKKEHKINRRQKVNVEIMKEGRKNRNDKTDKTERTNL